MTYQLIIFDMDGTLVQSEDCASQALIDVIPALNDSTAQVTARYRGMRLAEIFNDIEKTTQVPVPDNCLELYRRREIELCKTMITPSPGVESMLDQLVIDKCIASNAPAEKTRRSLELCGINHHFETIFSAYDVQAWKPDPALFEYAAKACQTDPKDCLVVEDSQVGISAAKAAGMNAVFYNPHALADCPKGVRVIAALSEVLDCLSA